MKDSFKIIFSQDAIGAYFGFLKYTRILCTSVSFSLHLWGHFFFLFFFPSFLSTPGEGGGNFAIFEETLNTFNIFLRAYQSSFTRGAYLSARAFSFAVGVIRWEIGPAEADGLPMQLPTALGTCHVFQLSLILKLETRGTSTTYTFEKYSLVCDFGTILRFPV